MNFSTPRSRRRLLRTFVSSQMCKSVPKTVQCDIFTMLDEWQEQNIFYHYVERKSHKVIFHFRESAIDKEGVLWTSVKNV